MLRLRVLLLLTSLDKCCDVGLFSSNNGSFFGEIFESVQLLDFFLLTMEFFFGDIFESVRVLDLFLLTMKVFFGEKFESVHWEVIFSLKRKGIRYEKRSIRRITDKLILKRIT